MKYRCKELRIDRDVKQIVISSYLGISQASYSDLENEKTMLTADYIIKLCKFYNVSADYLLRSKVKQARELSTRACFQLLSSKMSIASSI